MEELSTAVWLAGGMLWEFGMDNLEFMWDVATHPISLWIAGVQVGLLCIWILVMV